jgi:hypothetical protein
MNDLGQRAAHRGPRGRAGGDGRTGGGARAALQEALVTGEAVSLANVGRFSVRERAAGQGVDPRNPTLCVPARTVPRLSPAPALRRAVSEASAPRRP